MFLALGTNLCLIKPTSAFSLGTAFDSLYFNILIKLGFVPGIPSDPFHQRHWVFQRIVSTWNKSCLFGFLISELKLQFVRYWSDWISKVQLLQIGNTNFMSKVNDLKEWAGVWKGTLIDFHLHQWQFKVYKLGLEQSHSWRGSQTELKNVLPEQVLKMGFLAG